MAKSRRFLATVSGEEHPGGDRHHEDEHDSERLGPTPRNLSFGRVRGPRALPNGDNDHGELAQQKPHQVHGARDRERDRQRIPDRLGGDPAD
jgi:hypothetical protein